MLETRNETTQRTNSYKSNWRIITINFITNSRKSNQDESTTKKESPRYLRYEIKKKRIKQPMPVTIEPSNLIIQTESVTPVEDEITGFK